VLALQEDADKRHTRVRADYQAGLLTLDEARQDIGMQPLPKGQGDVFAVPFSITFTRPAELIPVDSPPPAKVPAIAPAKGEKPGAVKRTYRDVKALNPAQLEFRSSAIANNRKTQNKLATILDRKLKTFFGAQADRIAGSIEKGGWGPEVAKLGKLPLYSIDYAKSLVHINWQSEEDALAEILQKFYASAGEQAASHATSLLGVEISWDLANPHMNQVATTLGKRIRGIAETTRTDVSQTVADGLTAGKPLSEISDDVRSLIGGDSYLNRALNIATTESQVAYNSASVASYADSGVVKEAELADNILHDTDPGSDGLTCAERDGLSVPLSDVQQHIDGEHPRGTLAVLPVVELGS
jgi:hypothetical protein